MAQPDLNITTALKAIAEGLDILQLLGIDDSVPLSKLNELAQSLGYHDAQSVHSQVESDRDLDECYAEIRQLHAKLATLDTTRRWREKAEHRANMAEAQLSNERKALQSERWLRQMAEHYVEALKGTMAGIHEALDECQVQKAYTNGCPASARTRIFWLNTREGRAEALAQLVTKKAADLLERLANHTAAYADSFADPNSSWTLLRRAETRAARTLAAKIREVLNEHQAT